MLSIILGPMGRWFRNGLENRQEFPSPRLPPTPRGLRRLVIVSRLLTGDDEWWYFLHVYFSLAESMTRKYERKKTLCFGKADHRS